jgi:succinylarginine dihydrolase
VHLFVYGKSAFEEEKGLFPARQALEASQAIARRNKLHENHVIFARQNPELIDLGVIHNDLISTGHKDFFLYHERSFAETAQTVKHLKEEMEKICHCPLRTCKITEEMLPASKAIETYFFNSQIVTLPDQTELFLAPEECRPLPLVEWLPMQILFTNLRESMKNGGGPACLRLRINLTTEEKAKIHPYIFLDDVLYKSLVAWVEKHYRESLTVEDLGDPALLQESQSALDELTALLRLGSFYSFQLESACK